MTHKIEITEHGVSIRTQAVKRLLDPDTNEIVEIPDGPTHGCAVGLGDVCKDPANPTVAEMRTFYDRVDALLNSKVLADGKTPNKSYIGKKLAEVIADSKAYADRTSALAAKAMLELEADAQDREAQLRKELNEAKQSIRGLEDELVQKRKALDEATESRDKLAADVAKLRDKIRRNTPTRTKSQPQPDQ